MTVSMPTQGWGLATAPRLDGKVAIVTGATGGLGFETALGLARLGAETIVAGRDADKGAQAVSRILRLVASAPVRFERLDLASLGSIQDFAALIRGAHPDGVNILINNAAVMGLPARQLTEDGFERQIGVNYLGHFALTGRLRDLLTSVPNGGRVINVASLAHRRARLDLEDLQSERSYSPMRVYANSKLAMLTFALELQRRTDRHGWALRSIAVHPGWARTAIIPNGMGGGAPGLKERLVEGAFGLVAQSAGDGALPSLFAATAPAARGGAYYGPAGWGETRGAPAVARISPQASDPATGEQLWALSQRLTGVVFG